MTDLQQGGNAPLPGDQVAVAFNWTLPGGGAIDVDATAYLLTAAGKVRSDSDMIFYNQPDGAGGAVRFGKETGQRGGFQIDLSRLPADIEKIVFCVTIDEAQVRRQTLAMLPDATIEVSGKTGGEPLRFRPALAGATEAAMIFGELYRRNGQWKFRAVGQGFNGGLAPLARSFGIDVADEPAAAPPSLPPAPPPPPPAAPPPAPARPISLSKVTLDKPGQSISLEKKGSSFGEITVNLNWSRAKKKGLFGGGGNAVDLDLGCLFEMQDGKKHVIQALGNVFGSFRDWPYIGLSGDDRTGDVSQGETMRINGAHWSEIKRILVFANIYDGAPNWQQTDGVVLVSMPDQPPIEVRMTEGRNDKRLCGIVMIENDAGRLNAQRVVEYFRDQQELDRRFGWGLRWAAGSKD